MNKLLTGILAAVVIGVTVQAQAAADSPPEVTEDGLVLQHKGAFQNTWVHPDVDFTHYDKVMLLDDGKVEFRDVGPVRKSRSQFLRSHEREFAVPEQDRQRFAEFAGESFEKGLSRSRKFELSDRPGAGTLIVRGHVQDVVSHVPPPFVGSGNVYSNQVGQATVVLEVYDGATGQPLALAIERRNIQRGGSHDISTMMDLNSVTAWAEVRRWAGQLGSRLARGLDQAHKG